MGAIDVWAQITTERMAAAPWLAPLLRWTGQTDKPLVPSVAQTVAAMDAANVDIADCGVVRTARRAYQQ